MIKTSLNHEKNSFLEETIIDSDCRGGTLKGTFEEFDASVSGQTKTTPQSFQVVLMLNNPK